MKVIRGPHQRSKTDPLNSLFQGPFLGSANDSARGDSLLAPSDYGPVFFGLLQS